MGTGEDMVGCTELVYMWNTADPVLAEHPSKQ